MVEVRRFAGGLVAMDQEVVGLRMGKLMVWPVSPVHAVGQPHQHVGDFGNG